MFAARARTVLQIVLQNLEAHPPEPLPRGLATRANTPHEKNTAWQKNAAMLPIPYRDKDSQATFLAESAIRFNVGLSALLHLPFIQYCLF